MKTFFMLESSRNQASGSFLPAAPSWHDSSITQ
jgi:hypothetical protein